MCNVFTNTEPARITCFTGIGRCIVLGVDNKLICTYTGVPTPSVLWFKLIGNTRLDIPLSDAEYVVTHTPATQTTELTIRNVTSEDAGGYGCKVTNSLSGVTPTSISIRWFGICSKQANQIISHIY